MLIPLSLSLSKIENIAERRLQATKAKKASGVGHSCSCVLASSSRGETFTISLHRLDTMISTPCNAVLCSTIRFPFPVKSMEHGDVTIVN